MRILKHSFSGVSVAGSELRVKGYTAMVIGLILALILSTVLIGYFVVYQNINNKDVVFSFTALGAAILMFLLNVSLNLKDENFTKVIRPMMHLSDGVVDVYVTGFNKSSFVIQNRENISEYLGFQKESDIQKLLENFDSNKLINNTEKFLKITTVGTLLDLYPDWSPSEKVFANGGTMSYNSKREFAGKNSFYDINDIAKALELDDYFLNPDRPVVNFFDTLTLPPKTVLYTTGKNIVFENPYAIVEIDFEVSQKITRVNREAIGRKISLKTISDDDVLELHANIYVNVLRKKLRSGSKDYEKYTNWINRIIETIESSVKYELI